MADILLKDLSPGQQYIVQLRAVGNGEVSEWSQTVPFTTSADTLAPAPISGLSWTAVGTAFKAKWTAPTKNANGTTLKDFQDFQVTVFSPANPSITETFYTKEPNFTLSFEKNLNFFGVPRAQVTIQIRARDISGNLSSVVTATATNPAPPAPTGFSGSNGVDSIILTWNKVPETDIDYYEIYYSTAASGTGTLVFKTKEVFYVYHSVLYSTNHYFKIRAVDIFGSAGAYTQWFGPLRPKQTAFKRERFPTSGTFSVAPTSLSLAYTPLTDSEHLYLNGIVQDRDIDYTLSGSTVNILSSMGASIGDKIDVKYAYMPIDLATFGPYPLAVMSSNPFAYYRMDDAAVGTLVDITGNGHDAVSYNGTPTRLQTSLLATDTNTSTYFPDSGFGSTPQMYVLNNSSGQFSTSSFTIEFWTDRGGSGSIAVYQHDGRIRIENSAGNYVVRFWNTTSSSWVTVGSAFMTDGSFTYKMGAIVFDGATSKLRFYRGDISSSTLQLVGTYGQVGTDITVTETLHSATGSNPKFGNIDGNDSGGRRDELAFYNYAYSLADFNAHFEAR